MRFRIVALTLLLSGSDGLAADFAIETVPGFVAHGINTYNGRAIADYSKASPRVPWLNPPVPVREIGVLEEGAWDAGTITAATDRTLPVATTRSFFDFFNPTGEIDQQLVNQPLDVIGSNYFGFLSVDDRIVPTPFPSAGAVPEIHRAKEVIAAPTVGQWEAISGKMTVKTRSDGTAVVRITIRNGFPNGVYTLWDIGALNPLSEGEDGYAVPLGGIPNVLVTDAQGCGFSRIEVPYSPLRPCENGASSCTSYVSAFYHWDGQVYGGSPAATFANAATGVYAGNQIVFPTSGVLLQEPATRFPRPRPHGCRKFNGVRLD